MEYDNENDNSLIQNYSFDVRTPELDATGVNAARTRCSNENIWATTTNKQTNKQTRKQKKQKKNRTLTHKYINLNQNICL